MPLTPGPRSQRILVFLNHGLLSVVITIAGAGAVVVVVVALVATVIIYVVLVIVAVVATVVVAAIVVLSWSRQANTRRFLTTFPWPTY